MSYCINPNCPKPENHDDRDITCNSCGASLLLKNRYRVREVLGASPLGRTFLAIDEDKPSQPRCVIKEYFPEVRQQFRTLAPELEKLGKHPQIPEVWAYVEQDDYQYLVQEYIEGQNLGQELSQTGVFNEQKIWQLLSEILPVIQFAHENRVFHRDIKPETIIRRSPLTPPDQGGDIWLVDFGLLALPQNNGAIRDHLRGSAEYVAPEQLRGQVKANSDLYSLGVTCLHLLTDVSPFDLFDIKADTWVWRDYLKVPVSARLSRILDKLVERNHTKRYQSAIEVLKDLKYGPVALPIFVKKPQWQLTAWGGAAIAILSLILSSRIPAPIPQTSLQPEPHQTIPEFEPRFSPPEDIETNQIPIQTLAMTLGPVWSIALSPNRDFIASGTTNGNIEILDMGSGKQLKTLKGHTDAVWGLAISPDGKMVASGSADNTVKLWDVESGTLIKTFVGHQNGIFAVAFSPDGSTLASVGKDKTIRLWNIPTLTPLNALLGDAQEIQSVAFSPDGNLLASGSNDGTIKLWRWQSGELLGILSSHSDSVWSVAFSPDGTTLASGSWDNTIKLWDVTPSLSGYKGSLLRTLGDHGDKVQSLAFSPDGGTLASGDIAGTIKLWSMDHDRVIGTLKGHSSWVKVAFSNESDKILVSGSFDNSIKVWHLP
jgi:serine/threonine protein kinase